MGTSVVVCVRSFSELIVKTRTNLLHFPRCKRHYITRMDVDHTADE